MNKRSVAVVDGDRNVVLCSDGSLVVRADSDPEAIQFSATSLAFRPSFTAMGTWPGKAAADLSAEICDNAAFGVTGLVQDEGGKVSLTTEGKATIILGTLDNFRDKVSALKRAVEVEPEILSRVKVLNVSAPSNPVFVPK
ncbi:MAG: hypothetical protein JNM85_05810 [Chthonomonas sp.]|nr:hypothetical protein [Chthonomonas sp.]